MINIKIHKINLIFCALLLLVLFSCQLENAKESKYQFVNLYTESIGDKDHILFKKFEKKFGIKINVIHIQDSSFGAELDKNYQSNMDLILLNSYEKTQKLLNQNKLLKIDLETLNQIYDPNYKSKYNYWFAVSKTPLIIIYNKLFLTKDSINNYSNLSAKKWLGKICFQDQNNATFKTFLNTSSFVYKKNRFDLFHILEKQTKIPMSGNDVTQIERINSGKALLSVIKLSSLASYIKKEKHSKTINLGYVFPNQRKGAAIYSISTLSVFRYAKNVVNAKKLIQFLSDEKNQTHFAGGRYEYPIIATDNIPFQVENFGKFRARFYPYNVKNKKRP